MQHACTDIFVPFYHVQANAMGPSQNIARTGTC